MKILIQNIFKLNLLYNLKISSCVVTHFKYNQVLAPTPAVSPRMSHRLSPLAIRSIIEMETEFRAKHEKIVDLSRYNYRALIFRSQTQLNIDDVKELRHIFKHMQIFHKMSAFLANFYENIIVVLCYIRKNSKLDKENIPPLLVNFIRKTNGLPPIVYPNMNRITENSTQIPIITTNARSFINSQINFNIGF